MKGRIALSACSPGREQRTHHWRLERAPGLVNINDELTRHPFDSPRQFVVAFGGHCGIDGDTFRPTRVPLAAFTELTAQIRCLHVSAEITMP
jgi:hypothetical protein